VSYAESVVVDEYQDLVAAMHDDLQACSGVPTADLHNAADVDLDYTSLAEYLDTRGAGNVVKRAIEAAYVAEYGREIDEQSCLNFLLFIHADKRSKFTPFGVFSDERYHLIGGNQQIPAAIQGALVNPIRHGMSLLKVAKTAAGRIELTFKDGSKTVAVLYDAVVLAVPFTVLRDVELHASLGVPAWKESAIDLLGYGDNAKMMVGFDGRPWQAAGCNGTSYSNRAHHQTTWETNPIQASATRGVLTDYSGGVRGATLSANAVQAEANAFLADLEVIIPGTQASASTVQGKRRAHLEHWPSNPLTKGSYTSYLPGQFTTIANNEGKRVGHVHFAGEHANSFYEWQGFMEGAALSGLQAAGEILEDLKIGALS
jgi:monoamine oxidase